MPETTAEDAFHQQLRARGERYDPYAFYAAEPLGNDRRNSVPAYVAQEVVGRTLEVGVNLALHGAGDVVAQAAAQAPQVLNDAAGRLGKATFNGAASAQEFAAAAGEAVLEAPVAAWAGSAVETAGALTQAGAEVVVQAATAAGDVVVQSGAGCLGEGCSGCLGQGCASGCGGCSTVILLTLIPTAAMCWHLHA